MNGLYGHKYASGTRIGFVNNLSYTVEENTEVYHGAGRRYGWGIKGGALDVTVSLDGLWLDSGAQRFFLAETERTGALTAFVLGATGTDRGVTFSGCRVGTLDVEFAADGWATQSVDVIALTPNT
jgi:hypothetical protein